MYSELFIVISADADGLKNVCRLVHSGIISFASKSEQNSRFRWKVISSLIMTRVWVDVLMSKILRRRVNNYWIELELYNHATGKPPRKKTIYFFRYGNGWNQFIMIDE